MERRDPAEDERLVKVPLDGVLGRVDRGPGLGKEADDRVDEVERLCDLWC